MFSNKDTPIFLRLSAGLVALAAVLVPQGLAAEWVEEWLAEIWSKYETLAVHGRIEFADQLSFIWRCRGAFVDAGSLRLNHFVQGLGSPEAHELSRYAVTSFFGVYLVLFLLTDPVARSVVAYRYGYSSPVYAHFYWTSDVALCLGAYFAFFSLCRRTFGRSREEWRYIHSLLIGSLILALAVSVAEHSVSRGIIGLIYLEQNVFFLLLLQSPLLCVVLMRSGNSAGLKLLALGLWMHIASPWLNNLAWRCGLLRSSSSEYILGASSYLVVAVWLYVILIGRRPATGQSTQMNTT